MTPRLTAPQLTVLRALDAFGGTDQGPYADATWGDVYDLISQGFISRGTNGWPSLTPAGRALVARLKAEGAI